MVDTNTATGPEPELILEPPPGFIGLPVRGSAEDNTESAAELAQTLARYSGQPLRDVTEYVTVFADLLEKNKLRLCGRFAVTDPEADGPVLADLAIAVVTMGATDEQGPSAVRRNRNFAVARLQDQYRTRVPHADVRVLQLAMGPAMAAVTAGEYRLPPQAARNGAAVTLPQVKCEVQIPTSDGRHLVVLVVTTANEAACQGVLTAAIRTADSIQVEYPHGEHEAE